MDESRGGIEADRQPLLAGRETEPETDVRLAGAGVTDRDDVVPDRMPHLQIEIHVLHPPALCRFEAKGYPLPDFYSGATGTPGRFSEGLLLRRLHNGSKEVSLAIG